MEEALILKFSDTDGVECKKCILNMHVVDRYPWSAIEKGVCAALKDRPLCKKEGHRDNCPLVHNI